MELKQTPLYALHKERGGRMVPFAGWEMPVQYTSILNEHSRVRASAGLFDVSHMGQFLVEGVDSEQFLDYVCSSNMTSVAGGEAKYAILCNPEGGAVDDLIVYRIDGSRWLLIVNASNIEKDFAWLSEYASDYAVELTDQSESWALVAIQGPEVIQKLRDRGWGFPEKRFSHEEFDWGGIRVRVCRTGYTGEDGVECLCPAEHSEAFAKQLENCFGQDAWCGLGARDSLRLEAGLPLYGHELSDEIGPLEARMKWCVDFGKDSFMGKDALEGRLDSANRRWVKLFVMQDRRIARAGTPVVDSEGNSVGEVLSGSMSPGLQSGIGSALIPKNFKGEAFVSIRGKSLPITWKKTFL